MTARQTPRLRVGITLTGLTTLMFVLVFSLDSVMSWWQGSSEVRVVFDHVQGLRVNDPVHFQGVPCGRVVRLDWALGESPVPEPGVAFADSGTPEPASVGVTMSVPREVFALLRTGSEAAIEKTLTGVTIIDLRQGEGSSLTSDQNVIAGIESTSMEEVKSELHRSTVQVNEILEKLDLLVSDLNRDDLIPEAIRQIGEAGAEAKSLAAELRGIASESRETVDRVMTNAAATLERLADASEDFPKVLEDTRTFVENSGALAREFKTWFDGNRSEMSASVEDLAATAENVEAFVAEIKRRPWRLLHTPDPEEVAAIELYESGSAYAKGAIELRRAMQDLQHVVENRSDDPNFVTKLERSHQELAARLQKMEAFEEAFWNALKEVTDD